MTEIDDAPVSGEWSHLIDADDVESAPLQLSIHPDEEQKQALVARLGVLGIEALDADLTLKRNNIIVHVQGQLRAQIVQKCVVSLEPVKTHIEERFEGWFVDPEQAVSISKARREKEAKKNHAEMPIVEEHEDPEPIIDGKIDVGELATQYLCLAIDPYPHAQGVEYEHGDDTAQAEPSITRKNPFAALKEWKDKLT